MWLWLWLWQWCSQQWWWWDKRRALSEMIKENGWDHHLLLNLLERKTELLQCAVVALTPSALDAQ
jgi:hypothetical protein